MASTEDLLEIAEIMLRHKRNGLMVAYNAVRAVELEKGVVSDYDHGIYREGIRDAAAAILDEIHKLDEGDEDDRAKSINQEGHDSRSVGEIQGDDSQSGATTHEARPNGETGDLSSKSE